MWRRILMLTACVAMLGVTAGTAVAEPRPQTWTHPDVTEAARAELAPGGPEARLLDGVLAAFSMDDQTAATLLDGVVTDAAAGAQVRYAAASTLGGVLLRQGRYAAAASAFETALGNGELDEEQRLGLEQSLAVSAALAEAPAQTMDAYVEGAVPLTRDLAGLAIIQLEINGHTRGFVLDTGANLSVATESQARALGLTPVDGDVTVGSITSTAAGANLAVADRLVLGGQTFHDVVFLVMPDEALTFAGGAYRIEGILGFPVLSKLERLSFEPGADGERLSWSRSAPAPARPNLFVSGLTPHVYLDLAGERAVFALDTGANTTSLRQAAVDRHPELLENARREGIAFGGAGGETRVEGWTLPGLELTVDGVTVSLTDVRVSGEAISREGVMGRLGRDALAGGFVLDFPAGAFSLRAAD
jgi:predicted aspartyl protease